MSWADWHKHCRSNRFNNVDLGSFADFMIDRRKQIEKTDKVVQLWKAKNPAAWDKQELWQQHRDRELAASVDRRLNQHPDFV